ncbi:MAG: branched-chain amino acid transporter ATPase [Subtercola sp.]|nr:branched-chain amino acid transporter ATPase [Subtercola sp.]
MSALLSIKDVAVHYGGVKAVDGVTITVEQGIVYGLVGPNGSGKSTLLGAISRLTRITSGELSFDGHDYTHWTPQRIARQGLGRTFQTVRLVPTLTVEANIRLGADTRVFGTGIFKPWLRPLWYRPRDKEVTDIAREAIARLELESFRDRLPDELSYGTQRRVEIARALATNPSLLLLDEPTAGMTDEERDSISEVIRRLRREGLTQILVDHDVDMITGLADTMGVMDQGHLIIEGLPRDVVRDQAVQSAYLGRRQRADS